VREARERGSQEAVRVFWRTLAVSVVVLGAMASQAAAERMRSFDQDWRFALVNLEAATDPTGAYAHAADPGYDDSSWRALDLPHGATG
jgi:beta-galactosidase